jgi:hypothetical protein
MKHLMRYTLLTSIVLMVMSSCKKETTTPATTTDSTAIAVTNGTWKISSFTQKLEDNTSKYADMVFTFKADKTVIVSIKGTNSSSGSWSYAPPTAGYYGGPPSIASFTLSMGTSRPLDRLNKAWKVIEKSDVSLKLDNVEPLEEEHVIFTKN